MKFKTLLLPLALGAGMLVAQTTPPANSQPQHAQHHPRQMMMQKLTADLKLTPDQQAKAKQIFAQSREQRKALAPKLREERGAVINAIKSDNVPQIDRAIRQNSQVNAQAAEIHARAMAQFYAILTPDQKAKMDQKLDRFMRPAAARHGHAARESNSRGL